MAGTWTDVTSLKVQLLEGGDEATLYGNGLHQVGVIVTLSPTDAAGNPVSVTSQQLVDSVKLMNFVSGAALWSSKGDDRWFYATAPNEYFTPLEASGRAGAVLADGTAQITFYVMCGPTVRMRAISVAASVKPTGSSITRNTCLGSAFEGKIVLRALEPLVYKLPNGGTSGDVDWQAVPVAPPAGLTAQVNYYFSITATAHGLAHRLQKTTAEGYRVEHDSLNRYRSFSCGFVPDIANYAYAWGMATSQTAVVSPAITIQVNPRPHTFCATTMRRPRTSSDVAYESFLKLAVFDQYGNSGTFHVAPTYSQAAPYFSLFLCDGKPPPEGAGGPAAGTVPAPVLPAN